MEKLLSYFRSSKTELSKVFFPDITTTKKAAITVIIVVAVITLFIGLVDLIMHFSLGNIL